MTRRPCAQCGKNRALHLFASDRARKCSDCLKANRKRAARRRHVLETYGLSETDLARLLEYQGKVCAICQGERPYELNVDHDHETGHVRGLLCRRCNKVLRDVRDCRSILLRAADYLDWTPADLLGIEAKVDR